MTIDRSRSVSHTGVRPWIPFGLALISSRDGFFKPAFSVCIELSFKPGAVYVIGLACIRSGVTDEELERYWTFLSRLRYQSQR